jgi:hypothetical protein
MNIGGVGAPMPADTVSGASPVSGGRFEGQLQGVMNDMTGVLAMPAQQLNASISQAGSLSSVAAGKGVSEQQLVSTIKQGLRDAGSKLTGARLDNIASRIAHHRGVRVTGAGTSVTDQMSSTTLTPNTWKPTSVTGDATSA